MILLFLAAVPPLTEDQLLQLDSVTDNHGQLLEPGLDALMSNVQLWDSADETGARIPDYDVLLENPAVERGGLFLIEGRFAGRARRYTLGPTNTSWGDALTEWVILVRDDPEEVAVVYFLDPEGVIETPRTGASIRLVGRFYKVWADTDQDGEPTRYLTFVARSATVGGEQLTSGGSLMYPMLFIIVILGAVYFLLRYQAKRTTQSLPRHAMLSKPIGSQEEQDPAKALQAMSRQHHSPVNTGDNHGDR